MRMANPSWHDYVELCKPRIVLLMILTAVVGMCLSSSHFVPWKILVLGNIGIALAAASAAVMNHLLERHIDRLMQRTQHRPLAQGKMSPHHAFIFSMILCATSMILLITFTNLLTTLLTFLTIIGYAGIYTLYLKRATSQNIVIGGIAGAAPPLLGWVAVTGHIDAGSLLLMLIIFVWTPPHFWSLAIHRFDDYAKAHMPMLPNTHGIPYTQLHIFLYTLLLTAVSLLPFVIALSGWIYLVSALLLDAGFIYWAIRVLINTTQNIPLKTFRYSIGYLAGLFAALLIDHYI